MNKYKVLAVGLGGCSCLLLASCGRGGIGLDSSQVVGSLAIESESAEVVSTETIPGMPDDIKVEEEEGEDNSLLNRDIVTGNNFIISDCNLYINLGNDTLIDFQNHTNQEVNTIKLAYELRVSPREVGDNVELELDLAGLENYELGEYGTNNKIKSAVTIMGSGIDFVEVSKEDFDSGMVGVYTVNPEDRHLRLRFESMECIEYGYLLKLSLYNASPSEGVVSRLVSIPSPISLIPEQECDVTWGIGQVATGKVGITDALLDYDVEVKISTMPSFIVGAENTYVSGISGVDFGDTRLEIPLEDSTLAEGGIGYVLGNDDSYRRLLYSYDSRIDYSSDVMLPSEWIKYLGDSVNFDVEYAKGINIPLEEETENLETENLESDDSEE